MVWRRIGQEQLAIMGSQPRGDTSLDEMSQLVDWTEIDRPLAGVSAAAKGELAGLPWRCSGRWCWRHDTTSRTYAWPRRWMIGPAFVGSAALLHTSPRRSAPPSCASGASWSAWIWTGCCSRQSRVSLMPVAW